MSDTYRTLAAPASAEIKERGSRFLAEAAPAASAEAAEAFVEAVRRREHGATHHCTAYRVGPAGETFRYHDDGEPSGTAGAPILRQIDGRELTNTAVVVTRYYGGTKLGTGGLARAYGEAAGRALDAARIVEHVVRRRVRLTFDYADTSPALHALGRFDAETVESRYGAATELVLAVRRSQTHALVAAFTNALGGRGTAVVEEE